MSQLAIRYATALLQAGVSETQLRQTADLILSHNELYHVLISPAICCKEKQAVLHRLPFTDCPQQLHNFYDLLAEKSRFFLLNEILEQFHILHLRQQNKAVCLLRCAHTPSEQTIRQLGQAMCKQHGLAAVEMRISLEPELLGGFVLELEGVTYNKSVSGQLKRLSRQLQER